MITTSSLSPGIQGQAYSLTLQATGGTAPYHWSMTGQAIPGVQVSTSGVLSGTPSSTGIWDETTYNVQDSATPPNTYSMAISLLVVAPLVIQTTTFPTGGTQPNVGVNLMANFNASGGN